MTENNCIIKKLLGKKKNKKLEDYLNLVLKIVVSGYGNVNLPAHDTHRILKLGNL